LIPGAGDLAVAARRLVIVSNNSTTPAETFRAMAATQGLELASDHIHLAGQVLIEEAARRLAGRPVFVIGAPAMQDLAQEQGLCLVERDAEAVLLLRDPGFDYAKLTQAVRMVRAGALFWVANPDLLHPGTDGVVPETGALAAAVQAGAGRRPDLVMGKPYPHLYRRALRAAGVEPPDAVMIGDNPKTDLAGARRVGLRGLLVNQRTWHGLFPPASAGSRDERQLEALIQGENVLV
jgi:HAD superfamily hydrolase (TIGR01450 family)